MSVLPALAIGGYLPLRRDGAAWYVPWMMAFFVYVAALCGIGLVSARDASGALAQALSGALTVQVPAETSEARLQTVMGLLKQTKGVANARLMDRKEVAGLLEPWLGPSAPVDELPVPRLIDVQTAPDGSLDPAALRQQLASVLPEGRLEDHGAGLAGMRGAARRVEAMLMAGIVLAVALVALLAMYAVREAFVIEQDVVELIHLLGARDADLARKFTLGAGLMTLGGGILGALTAIATNMLLEGTGGFLQFAGSAIFLAPSDWRLWVILAGAVVCAALVAMVSARLTLLRRLAALP